MTAQSIFKVHKGCSCALTASHNSKAAATARRDSSSRYMPALCSHLHDTPALSECSGHFTRTFRLHLRGIESVKLVFKADWMCLAHVHGCRWRNFLSPDIEHPRKSPFTEWEIAVVVLVRNTQHLCW